MTVFVLTALGVVIVLVAVAFVLVRRGLRRAVRHFGGWHSRLIEVRTRFLPPGPRRDAGRLRTRLHAELSATRDMLQAAPRGLIFRADATEVLRELVTTAAALDGELAAVGRFIDPVQQRTALTTLTPQVNALIETTYTARHTILRTAGEDRARQLAALRAGVAEQAAALDTYQRNGRELSI